MLVPGGKKLGGAGGSGNSDARSINLLLSVCCRSISLTTFNARSAATTPSTPLINPITAVVSAEISSRHDIRK